MYRMNAFVEGFHLCIMVFCWWGHSKPVRNMQAKYKYHIGYAIHAELYIYVSIYQLTLKVTSTSYQYHLFEHIFSQT